MMSSILETIENTPRKIWDYYLGFMHIDDYMAEINTIS